MNSVIFRTFCLWFMGVITIGLFVLWMSESPTEYKQRTERAQACMEHCGEGSSFKVRGSGRGCLCRGGQ